MEEDMQLSVVVTGSSKDGLILAIFTVHYKLILAFQMSLKFGNFL
jgi:hypothetical protein